LHPLASPTPTIQPPSISCLESAILFDLDGTFDPLRLDAALAAHLANMGLGPLAVAAAASAALARLSLCSPSSSFEWLAALRALPVLLSSIPSSSPRLLLIDNASAFYWPDRARPGVPASVATADAASLAGAWPAGGGGAPAAPRPHPRPPAALTLARVAGAAAACLKALARSHRCAVVVTRHAVLPGSAPAVGWGAGGGGGGGGGHGPSLPPDAAAPPAWAGLATRRAALAPGPPAPAGGPPVTRVWLEWVPTPGGGPVPPGERRALLECGAGGVRVL
jgi:hypothetical protein